MYLREFVSSVKQEKEELPFDIEDDLVVYMRNDPMFYRKHYYPALLKMQSAYNSNQSLDAGDLWVPLVKQAIIPYMNKFNINKKPESIIDKNKIRAIASKIYSEELNHIKNGSYK